MVVHADMTQLSVASPRLRKLHRNGWTCVFDHIQVPHYATIKAMIHLQYVMWWHVHIMYISCITHTHKYIHAYIYISINKYIYIYTCINGFLLPNTIFSQGIQGRSRIRSQVELAVSSRHQLGGSQVESLHYGRSIAKLVNIAPTTMAHGCSWCV